jgi:alkylation response protein AidB-like acyl-CoA dehydrogenase
MTEEEKLIQQMAHRFAEEVMRPIGEQLDKMTPEEVIAEGSPLYTYLQKVVDSGLLDLGAIAEMTSEQKARIIPIIFEEFGWGDSGLAILTVASSFPSFAALMTGDEELIEKFSGKLGCWVATQPDRGSDCADLDAQCVHPGSQHAKGNLIARIDGDEVVITGQSSAWVTGAPIAESAYVFCGCDFGDGIHNYKGGLHCIAALVPLDLPGVSKGKPLDKIGQRALPQGEIYFDEVRIPRKYVLAEKEEAEKAFFGTLTFANMEMGFTFTGVARAAYDHAIEYVHERKQGGTEIINHQSVKLRLFNIFQKTETARAMAHRAAQYNYGENGPHLLASITSKTFVTQNAYDAAGEAMSLFGGNGLTREYPLEKLLRDARASLIEDGENNLLSLKAAQWLSDAYKAKQ